MRTPFFVLSCPVSESRDLADLFFVTGCAALVACHLGLLPFGGLFHPLPMAFEAILEPQFIS